MQPNHKAKPCTLFVLTLLCWVPIFAQNASVTIGKRASRIPRSCEGVVSASIDRIVDIPALVKEAYCKGAGDMMTEYSYVMNSAGRSKDKKGQEKEDSTTYEVFIPTLKSGTRGKGVLVVTSRNGVPVPPDELEKARKQAGERLEKAEEKSAREARPSTETDSIPKGMLPLGAYMNITSHRSSLLGKEGNKMLSVHSFLRTCELTLARREQHEGRSTLVFNFAPRPDAQFADNESYIAQLTGEIWIDAQDRIVTRLVAWPSLRADNTPVNPSVTPVERPPAAFVEMMRLPEGVWLPHVMRINAADYQTLFDGINRDSTSTFSNYIRFSTEIKDIKVNTPDKP